MTARSRADQQAQDRLAAEVGFDCGGEVVEAVPGLPMARLHDRQDRFREAAA